MIRILIVDPEAGPRADLEQIFADRGDDVARAASCAEGLEVVSTVRPLAVLCAATSSAAAGRSIGPLEFCRELRQTFPAEQLSIVLYSRTPLGVAAMGELLEAGADIIASPDQMRVIEAVLDAALRTRARLRQAADTVVRLRDDNRRLDREGREHLQRIVGDHASDPALIANELVASRPDGVLIVGTDGRILSADKGAEEMLGRRLAGHSIGAVVPRSRLASFVGKAGPDEHDRFSFDVSGRSDRASRRLQATVTSVVGPRKAFHDEGASADPLRVVLLLDLGRRGPVERVARNIASRVPDQYYRRLLRVARVHHALKAIPQHSEASVLLVQALAAASRTHHPVLLRGPDGSGRGAYAEALHHARHSTGPFLELACDGLGEVSQEAELFGERFATGEKSGGLVARATDGTLVLHEVEYLSFAMQSKVAAVSKDPHLRLIATSRSSADALVTNGRLLAELANIFAGSVIEVPPLRDRRQDLPEMIARTAGRETFERITTPALRALVAWDWPGGIAEFERELGRLQGLGPRIIDTVDLDPEISRHALIHAGPECLKEVEIPSMGATSQGALLADGIEESYVREAGTPGVVDGFATPKASPTSLPSKYEVGRSGAWVPEPSDWIITDKDPLDLEVYQRKALLRALAMANGNRTLAAELVGIGKSTYYRKLNKWGLSEAETAGGQQRPQPDCSEPGDGEEASPPT